MVVETSKHPTRSRGDRKVWPRVLASIVFGIAVAFGAERLTSGVIYRAHAVIGIEDVITGASVVPDGAPLASIMVLTRQVFARAAVTLREQGFLAGLIDRVAGTADSSAANSQDDRLTRRLASAVSITREQGLDGMSILAIDEKADRAAAIATAVAEAYVADRNETLTATRRKADGAAALRLQTLTDAVEAARRRLAALDADGMDPAQARAAASLAAANAKARYDAFQLVIASSTPPLGAAAGLPSAIAPLQTEYLDLKRQLSEAQRTMGERHTTVIALQDSLRLSAKTLTVEWKRLAEEAEAVWLAARDREAALGGSETASDIKTRSALNAAREALRESEVAVRRFQTSLDVTAKDLHYRLVAPAAVPGAPDGLPAVLRIILAAVLGCACAGIAILPIRRRTVSSREVADPSLDMMVAAVKGGTPDCEVGAPAMDQARSNPSKRDRIVEAPEQSVDMHSSRPAPVFRMARPTHETMRTRRADDAPRVKTPSPRTGLSPMAPKPETRRVEAPLLSALDALVPALAALLPKAGSPRLVFVGSLDSASATGPVALALARAASLAGLRVLLIEGERPRPLLAAAVDLDAQPILIDVLGTLRIGLPVDPDIDFVIAPFVPNAKRLVAGLARRHDVTFVDDVASAFDLAIVDGGHVDADTADDWSAIAAASLRVARHVSRKDDEQFLQAIGGCCGKLYGRCCCFGVGAEDRFASHRPDPRRARRRGRSRSRRTIECRAPAFPRPQRGSSRCGTPEHYGAAPHHTPQCRRAMTSARSECHQPAKAGV